MKICDKEVMLNFKSRVVDYYYFHDSGFKRSERSKPKSALGFFASMFREYDKEYGHLVIDGFIPLFYIKSVRRIFCLTEDGIDNFSFGKVRETARNPQRLLESEGKVIRSSLRYNGLRSEYWNFYDRKLSGLEYMFYNPRTEEIVYSLELNERLIKYIKKNYDIILNSLPEEGESRYELKCYNEMDTPKEFIKRINKYFADRGFEEFKVTDAIPHVHYGITMILDKENALTKDRGYYIDVTYKGKPYVGGKGQGWVFVADEDDEIRLVHSAWCQHVTAWSKQVNVVDQNYAVWEITDWLTGPLAEKLNVEIDSMPIVFSGNNYDPYKKKNSVERLKRRMESMRNRR